MAGASFCLAVLLATADGGGSTPAPVITSAHAVMKATDGASAPPARPAAPPATAKATRDAPAHPGPPSGGAAPGAAAGPVFDVMDGTSRLVRAIIARDLETLVQLTPAPFSFDGVTARTTAEVRQRWAEVLDRHPVERLRLFDVQVLPYDAAVQKYGKPPARLAGVSLAGSQIGVANLGGRATVVVWRRRARGFAAVAVSD